jgi:hypothetical protein
MATTLVEAARARKAPGKLSTTGGKAGKAVSAAENNYGSALGDVAGQAYTPLKQRVSAGAAEARANRARMDAMQGAAATSQATYGAETTALASAGAAQMAQVQQNAKPQLITARSAIASANSYAARVGINIKDMNAQAKAQLYQAIIAQNTDMMKMQLQSQLDFENQQKLYDLQAKAAVTTELKGAPAVVTAVTGNMPSMLSAVQAYVNDNNTDKLSPAQAATAWAQTVTTDPAAATMMASVMTTLLVGANAHTDKNGTLDGNWIRTSVINSVHAAYPDYANDSTVSDALSNGVLSSMLMPSIPGGWESEAVWNSVLGSNSYQSWAVTPTTSTGG